MAGPMAPAGAAAPTGASSSSAGRAALAARQAQSRVAWAGLRDQLRTVTPSAAGRAALVATVTLGVAAAIIGTWPALLPFAVGGLIAWAVLPIVDSLDRFMPRTLAAIASVVGVLAALVALILVIAPPFALALVEFARSIPGQEQINSSVGNLVAGLPDETRQVVEPILVAAAAVANDTLSQSSTGLHDIVQSVIAAVPQIAGAILGLVVLPTWVVTVMTSNRRARFAVDTRLAASIRPDFWAIVRMADRSLRTFFKAYVGQALAIGTLTYAATQLSPQVGGPTFNAPLALAAFAGVVQLVPELGPILGLFPALLIVAVDPQRAAVYIGIYLVARLIGSRLVDNFVARDPSNIHRAVIIPGVVVLSQVGPLALLLSAPILGFGSDLVRYLHGRLSEPARPAGVLPDESVPPVVAKPAVVPPVYRSAPRLRTPARTAGTVVTR